MADDKSTIKSIGIDLKSALNDGIITPLNEAKLGFDKLDILQEHLNELTKQYNELKKSGSQFAKEDLADHKEAIKELEKAIKLKRQYNASPLKTFAKTTFGIRDKQEGEALARNLGLKLNQAFKTGANVLQNALGISWRNFQQILSSTIKEMGNMLQSSLLTNSKTRQNVFTYGMSGSESYGFEQAKTMMGINSDEDLMYMNSQQSKMFREIMSKYAKQYSELYDKGYYEQMLEFQIQRKQFQQDIELALIKMFIDNKELIISGFHALMNIAEKINSIISWIGARQSATASDVLNNYSTKNISVDTTFNITGQIDKEGATTIGSQVGDYWDSFVKNS